MNRLSTLLAVTLSSLTLVSAAWSQSDSNDGVGRTPGEGIEFALQRAAPADWTNGDRESSRWLAAVPTVSMSQIESRDSLGTDETELALNLPLKSPARHRADGRLRLIDAELETAQQTVRRLFFSGLIREAWWSHRLAVLELDGIDDRLELLQDLVERQQALARTGNVPAFSLLLARRELITARAEAARLESEAARWRARYEQLTGRPPPRANTSDETEATETQSAGLDAEHPALRLITLDWQRQQALLDANTSAADDWTLGLVGRRQTMPGFTDEQFGLTLEIPLSFLPVVSQSERSDRRAGAREFLRSRDALLADIESRSSQLRSERQALEVELDLLREAVELDDRIAEQLSALATGSAIESELLLRRRLDLLSTRLQLRLTEARLGQNLDLMRQTLGVPL